MTFIFKVLFFDIILGWGSLFIFWSAAIYFCFCGTKSLANITKEKTRALSHFLIGLPFFLVFYFIIKINGVPEYMVYDHVKPLKSEYGIVYPAVQLHPLLQFSRFEQEGIITADLSKFVGNVKLFNAFKVQRIQNYSSINGYVSYVNEATLFGLFILWYLFVNRLHNSISTTSLYRHAIEKPKVCHYKDYLDASQSVRMFQPFKRKKARKALAEISNIYNKQLVSYLGLLNHKNPHSIYDSLIEQLSRCTVHSPTLNVDVIFEQMPSKQEIKLIDDVMDYGSDKTLPTSKQLSDGFSSILTTTLNNFLSEDYIVSSSSLTDTDIQIKLPFRVIFQQNPLIYLLEEVDKKFTWIAFASIISAQGNSFQFDGYFENKPKHTGKFGVDKWKDVATIFMSKTLVEKFLQGNANNQTAFITKSKEKIATELAALAQQKNNLFDDVYKETLSAAKGEMVDQAIAIAIKQNSDCFDLIFAKTYDLTITNLDGVFADLLSSGLFSLADSLEGEG
ncbi:MULTISPECIES: hypothetical protein [unclassified Colwellia]|uniref:hypothetical protein n=1 Tax=unclassified Colwellia TaxID=196834 RepID=UPI0015F3BB9F|nr:MULTISPECIES: hypothetical protein [unclassified Colwellia]MBA6356628.1 hypothetical protein [Colwellia sp. BRX8-3]MBA6360936.1 hypothetical protein [Colwellia sp. BRX8-6]MBA6368398.1 hypothetical protein [Colwellia sp. BRX8-5]MBA6377288.1 hypothetical protein [Colwellia sp. BRX8-2]